MSDHKKLFKSAGVVGFFTLLSRILGFIRDIIIANLFGTNMAAQAFVIAFRIPNMLRDFVGEGATNAAIIPVLSESLSKNDKKEFWHVNNILLNFFILILLAITIIGVVFAPFIVKIIAFGFIDNPAKLELTIKLTRIMFSFIIFIGLAAYAMGILNTLKHFAMPALGPCLLNLVMIIFGLWVCPRLKEPILGMAFAVLIGGLFQLIIQIPAMRKYGFNFKFSWQLRHDSTKRIGVLLVPRMIGSSIYQLNIFVDTIFASLGRIVGDGAVAALYYANRIVQFPTAIFGIALATACLPTMSQHAVENNIEKLKETLVISLRSLLVLLIPSSVGLFVLSVPIIKVLFQRGEFNTVSTQMTALALMFYSIGIFAYSGARVTTSCFYSLKDTITPVRITFFCLVLNIILNIALMHPLKVGGLALSTSISSTVNLFVLLFLLRKKIGKLGLRHLIPLSLPIITISLAMGCICWFGYKFLQNFLKPWISLLIVLVLGKAVFISLGWFFGIFKGFHFKVENNR